jgi:arylsulfatase
VTLYPDAYLTPFSVPAFVRTSPYVISADVELANGKEQGVLLSLGGYLGGLSLYVKDGKLAFAYNAEGKTVEVISNRPLGKGTQTLKAEIRQKAGSRNKSVELYVNGSKVAERQFESSVAYHSTEGLDVGSDVGTAVTSAYKTPFNFTGKVSQVTLENLSQY